MRVIRLVLYVIELLIFWPIVIVSPGFNMGHPIEVAGWPVAIGLGVVGTIGIVNGLKRPGHPIRAFFLGSAGLCLHALAIPVLVDVRMLSPANWSKWYFSDFVCFQGGFLALAAVDLWITRRILQQNRDHEASRRGEA